MVTLLRPHPTRSLSTRVPFRVGQLQALSMPYAARVMELTFDFYDGGHKTVCIDTDRLAPYRAELALAHQAGRVYWVATNGARSGKDTSVSRLLEAVQNHQVVDRYETRELRAG